MLSINSIGFSLNPNFSIEISSVIEKLSYISIKSISCNVKLTWLRSCWIFLIQLKFSPDEYDEFRIELDNVLVSSPGKDDYSVNLSNSVSNSITKFIDKKPEKSDENKKDSNSGNKIKETIKNIVPENIKNAAGGSINKTGETLGEVKGVITEKLQEEKEGLENLEEYSDSDEYKELEEKDQKKHKYKLFFSKTKVNTLEIIEKVSRSNILLSAVLIIILILLIKLLLSELNMLAICLLSILLCWIDL